jgi:hypothetical protein
MSRLHGAAFPPKGKVPTIATRVGYVMAIGALVLSFMASCTFVAISRWNYPGGDALRMLSERLRHAGTIVTPSAKVKVHIDVASAMTGVNLFGQRAAQLSNPSFNWTFVKAGYEQTNAVTSDVDWSVYSHLLTESDELAQADESLFYVVGVAQGNPRLDLRRVKIVTSDAIFVLERNDWKSQLT